MPDRLHALDSLRAVAMLLGIVLHAALSLATVPIPWPAHDLARSAGFDLLLAFIHGFRMQVFFFLAGFFGHLLWQRHGKSGFIRNRLQRIGIPFVAAMLILIPLILGVWIWSEQRNGGRFLADRMRDSHLLSAPTAHLWFLQMLLLLYAAALLIAWLGERLALQPWLARMDSAFDVLIAARWKPFVLALPAAALVWGGPRLPEVDEAGMRLVPAWRAVAYWGLFFATGWWMHRRLHLLDLLRRWVGWHFGLAALAFVTVGICLAPPLWQTVDPRLLRGGASLGAGLYAWAMTFGLTGLFLRTANVNRPWARYLADASYWWYLWHVPILMALQVLVARWPVSGWIKLPAMLAVTVAVLWPSYHFMVRYTFIGRTLNGPRSRPDPR